MEILFIYIMLRLFIIYWIFTLHLKKDAKLKKDLVNVSIQTHLLANLSKIDQMQS